MSESTQTQTQTQTQTPSVRKEDVGKLLGRVKWFRNNFGYGFVTIVSQGVPESGNDVFVHQSNINPLVSTYRTLVKDEYISFDLSDEEKAQAINVRGVEGGPLRCDAPRPPPRQKSNASDSRNNHTNSATN
jgi:cold shock CspA family protein